MTPVQKILISALLEGGYIRKWKSHGGSMCYRMYDGAGNPVRSLRPATVKALERLVKNKGSLYKKDRVFRITFNLSQVRQVHGRAIIKKQYKSRQNKKS
jgi:hypothetical protein